jgi:hypothetical protein
MSARRSSDVLETTVDVGASIVSSLDQAQERARRILDSGVLQ